MGTLRVTSLSAVPQPVSLRISRISGQSALPTNTRTVRVSSVKVNATVNTQPVLGAAPAPQTVEPYDTVTSTITVAAGTIASYTWRQISGPTVTLTPAGASVSFLAPATMAYSTIVLGVVGTDTNGVKTAEVQTTINTYSHTIWYSSAGKWLPIANGFNNPTDKPYATLIGNSGPALQMTTPPLFATWMARDTWGNLKDANWVAFNDGFMSQVNGNANASVDIGVPLIPHDMSGQPGNWNTLLDAAINNSSVDLGNGTLMNTDDIYKAMGANLSNVTPTNGTLYARVWWEFNMNPAASASLNTAKFIAAWNRAIPLIRQGFAAKALQQGRKQTIKIVWCPISDGAAYAPYYPADSAVDIVALDAYASIWGTTIPTATALLANLKTQLDNFAAFAATKNKPVALGEWGNWQMGTAGGSSTSHGRGDFPEMIDFVFDWLAAQKAVYASYFNLSTGGVGQTMADTPLSNARYTARTLAL